MTQWLSHKASRKSASRERGNKRGMAALTTVWPESCHTEKEEPRQVQPCPQQETTPGD